ncbi:hypothetical protein [Roseibium sp.]|uniref:hypothetical protein n=1 Tax=Roseibium sp. TaxID=1936156 RepID=UPI003B524E5D
MIRMTCFVGCLFWAFGSAETAFGLDYSKMGLSRGEVINIAGQVNKMIPEKVIASQQVNMKNNKYSVRFSGGKLNYRFSVLVPNHCYKNGRVSHFKKKSDTGRGSSIIFNVEILHQPGLCSQSVKTLKYSGSIAIGNTKPDHVYVRLLNRLSGTETVEQVF